jgi:hypothetical protein
MKNGQLLKRVRVRLTKRRFHVKRRKVITEDPRRWAVAGEAVSTELRYLIGIKGFVGTPQEVHHLYVKGSMVRYLLDQQRDTPWSIVEYGKVVAAWEQ